MNSEIIRFIRKEIERQLNVVLTGVSGNSTEQSEDIGEMFPAMPVITQRPVMHPYGFVSKSPDGKLSVVARQGEHSGNRLVLGHRDSGRPTDFERGEVILYNEFGQQIRVQNGKIQVGSPSSDEPLILGNVQKQFWTDFITTLLNEPGDNQIGFCPVGPVFLLPSIAAEIRQQKLTYVDTADTNIVSRLSFTQRDP